MFVNFIFVYKNHKIISNIFPSVLPYICWTAITEDGTDGRGRSGEKKDSRGGAILLLFGEVAYLQMAVVNSLPSQDAGLHKD